MKFYGRALSDNERNRLLGFAAPSGADECYIGFMKMEDEKYYWVARFYKNDEFLFYVSL